MNEQETLDYARIAQAIGYIRENFKRQPGLDEIAREVALSTAHFQRMFTEWAGIHFGTPSEQLYSSVS